LLQPDLRRPTAETAVFGEHVVGDGDSGGFHTSRMAGIQRDHYAVGENISFMKATLAG